MKLFRFFAAWLDPATHDAMLEQQVGEDYAKVRGALGLALFCVLMTLLATGVVWITDLRTPPPTYLATTPKGVSGQLPLMNEPVYSASKVQDWTVAALKDTFSFNFVNINDELRKSQAYFTPDGWDAFYTAMQHSNVMANVTRDRLEVFLTPLGEARIIGICQSEKCLYKWWRVEVPVIITYSGAAPPQARKQLITVLVMRQPTTDNPNGLGISQLNVAELQ